MEHCTLATSRDSDVDILSLSSILYHSNYISGRSRSNLSTPDIWLSGSDLLRVCMTLILPSGCQGDRPHDLDQSIIGTRSWGFIQMHVSVSLATCFRKNTGRGYQIKTKSESYFSIRLSDDAQIQVHVRNLLVHCLRTAENNKVKRREISNCGTNDFFHMLLSSTSSLTILYGLWAILFNVCSIIIRLILFYF